MGLRLRMSRQLHASHHAACVTRTLFNKTILIKASQQWLTETVSVINRPVSPNRVTVSRYDIVSLISNLLRGAYSNHSEHVTLHRSAIINCVTYRSSSEIFLYKTHLLNYASPLLDNTSYKLSFKVEIELYR